MSQLMRRRGTVLVSSVLAAAVALSLAAQAPPQGQGPAPAPAPAQGPGGGPRRRQPGAAAWAPGRVTCPCVDAAAATRGRPIYAAQCINCHGTQARGTDKGANLVRSLGRAARSLRQRARAVPEEGAPERGSGHRR